MAIPLKLWTDDEYRDNEAVVPTIANILRDDSRVVMHLGDTYEFLQTLPSGLAKLIITSPPYQPQGKVSRVPAEWKNGAVAHVYGDMNC